MILHEARHLAVFLSSCFPIALRLIPPPSARKCDRGGSTNHGITQATYDAWRELHGRPSRSVRAIEHAEVDAIYREQFANKILFDKLPLGLDYALFDFAVNSGVSRAVRFLQRILKVRADGSLGAKTLAALAEADVGQVIKDLCKDRLRFLRRLKAWKHFGKGWAKRVNRAEMNALAMIAGGQVVAATEPDGAALGLGQQKLSATVADNKAAAVGLFGAAGTALEQAADVKFSLLSVFDNIPSWFWLALVAGLFAYIIWSKHRVAVKD
ncbi:glycosyl hydrolase 108 family protein [uncultured Cardiobacterium sp.]|uniref:glycoside hydrolase family 108 protein n=1 Tax=uncultured Cardiobacterium sp. TaxID=417619 RepID=UPI0026387F91|nr:glycosyl hydrolase 108 family protein [uncultured Cardiobacterium sp.]